MIEQNKIFLITGGTGSFGQAMVDYLLNSDINPEKIIIYSRDEFKQNNMIKRFGGFPNRRLRFFLGDVRDKNRLNKAMFGVNYVFHAAALKQVPLCEYNPSEPVQTNIIGSMNVIDAAINNKVEKVIALSTDKAVNPVNLYGATKLCAEKLFINANTYGRSYTRFGIVRYGNVLASRGSVVEEFEKQAKQGIIFVTHRNMTRFWWTLDQAVAFVLDALNSFNGGEIFIPKIRSSYVKDLAAIIGVGCRVKNLDEKRPGEKIHEVLISPDEIDRVIDIDWSYYIQPQSDIFESKELEGEKVDNDFSYSSDKCLMDNLQENLKEMLNG